MIIRLLLVLFLFFFTNLFSQTGDYFSKLKDSIKEYSNNEDFVKAICFFDNQQDDSSYVYCAKALSIAKNQKEKDFFNYLQAFAAYAKGLYKQSLICLNAISDDKYYTLRKASLEGVVFINIKEYEKAIFSLESYLQNEKLDDEADLKVVYHNLGLSYLFLKSNEKASFYFDKQLSLINETDTLSLIELKKSLANVYYEQYMDNKAIPLFKEAYNLAKKYSDLKLKETTAFNMAVVEKNRKRYKESIKYYEEYNRWKDSIWNRDKIWKLTEKDKQLAIAQKQQEIAVQDEQIKRQKVVQTGLLLGASGLLVFIGGLGYFYRRLKRQKELITEQKEALATANKTKNYLFSVVSHDLRSPINSIKRQHQKLVKHVANNDLPAIKESVEYTIAVTDSTSHLLNNVLHWSLEQGNQLNFNLESIVLKPIIEQVLFDYEDIAESKEIDITANLDTNLLVQVDKESLKIVLRNLIDNAIKYMNGVGGISVTTSKENEHQARIAIADTGIGISEEKLQKINTLTDLSIDKIDRSKGVGLGLLLCQTLIKKNNGTLFFQSEEHSGTTASILLPLA